ncbi:hypothetical protein H1C71_041463 [Ictidomys tridecemlineatus]|nr:hypothetical protein H1C71_041463 [Ictidomys tridecemlineatus]
MIHHGGHLNPDVFLQIYMPLCALEMHIQQRRVQNSGYRSSLNSPAVKIGSTLLTSVSLGFIKAVTIATSFSQGPEMLHFILFFNGKAEGQIIILPHIPFILCPHTSPIAFKRSFMDIKDGFIFKWNNTVNQVSYRTKLY